MDSAPCDAQGVEYVRCTAQGVESVQRTAQGVEHRVRTLSGAPSRVWNLCGVLRRLWTLLGEQIRVSHAGIGRSHMNNMQAMLHTSHVRLLQHVNPGSNTPPDPLSISCCVDLRSVGVSPSL